MACGFLVAVQALLQFSPGSTRVEFTSQEFKLTTFWRTKSVAFTEIYSTRLLTGSAARGLFRQKAVIIIKKSGEAIIVPNCNIIDNKILKERFDDRLV